MMMSTALLAFVLLISTAQDPQPSSAAARDVISPAADLNTLTLVMSSADRAVVRFGPSTGGTGLIVVEPGDRIGRSAAVVREITSGRLVLDEVTNDKSGRPHRVQIVLRDGHTGGQRYMRDAGMDAPIAVRPEVLDPKAKAKMVKEPGPRS